jgi:hypothetical protein
LRRHAAVLLLGLGALLVTPGAAGEPDVPGDPTPPVVTPVISGTLGNAGWYTSNVTVNWSIVDPESIILSTTGCNAVTFTTNTIGTQLTCTAESRRRNHNSLEDVQGGQDRPSLERHPVTRLGQKRVVQP